MPEEYTTYKPEWIDKEKQQDAKFASFVMTGITKSNTWRACWPGTA